MVNANPKSIELYVLVDGNEVPFYGRSYAEFVLSNGDTFVTKDGFVFNVVHSNEQVKVGSFRYDAKRMGGAPIITFTLMYDECLDKLWSDQVYAKFRGERYFLKQTPTSSKSNDDARYRHDVELIAERTILDNAYFYDAVVGSPIENDVPVTNSTKFHFYGHIEKFVERMNASLQYTGIQKVDEDGNVVSGYRVVLDDDVVTRDQKQVSFDSAVFSQALQESYNTFGIPFYFDGQTIHIGFTNNVIGDVLEYGVDGALISATKTNANFKVINRATGNGSSDNIPYYYPNNAPKGELAADVVSASEDYSCTIVDNELFSEKINIDSSITYKYSNVAIPKVTDIYKKEYRNGVRDHHDAMSWRGTIIPFDIHIESPEETTTTILIRPLFEIYKYQGVIGETEGELASCKIDISLTIGGKVYIGKDVGILGYEFDAKIPKGSYSVRAKLTVNPNYTSTRENFSFDYGFEWNADTKSGWYYEDKEIDLEEVGLSISEDATLTGGDTITQRLVKKVNTSSTLQPSIYRATDGKERFYNAVNYPFAYVDGYELKYGEYVLDGEVHNDAYKKDDGTYYEFTNEYKEGRPREHVFTVDDIKPTIKEATNNISWVETDEEGNDKTIFQRIDMFSDFAYNIGDNDETYTDPNGNTSFKHPYFFAKLRKLDFNLFEHASEMGEMTFSMTSGHCGACNFKIGVSDDYPQFNTVQVDEDGNLVYDENGYVLCGLEDFQGKVEPQDRQQDTVNYEVWIALKKEEDTYGILMPKAPKYEGDTLVDAGHRPAACSSENANDGDTFVILNINLPDEYIYRAEKKLEKAIVKYIWENNVEKFNFSVNFSRIFLEENYLLKGDESVLSLLNENARLARVKYNGDEYTLYVSSYSYSMNDGDVLPEIRVELDDTLTISQNALQNAINEVRSEIGQAIDALDVAAIGSRYFLRKDVDDVAQATIDFRKGVFFGEGGDVSVYEDGSAKLTIDYLEVTKKATFTSLEIQEKTHAGGQILLTPAAMVCNGVEELDDVYRCYFQTKGDNGQEIFNQFAVDDQAISQTFNEWGGHYYWRLVVGVGDDYIDLSKTECAPESDIPSIGDKIVQLGNQTNVERQNAIVIAAYGDGSPYIIQYKGINSFEIGDDKVVTKLSSTENIFTGKVHMEMGSDGLGDLQEFVDLQALAGKANTNATNAQNKANTAMSVADRAQQSADTANTNALQAGESASAATEKAEEAIGKAEAAQDGLDNMEIGGTNLLRNSGFTGDYLSEQLADEKVLEGAAELYSSPLDHWSSTATTVINSDDTISGKAVSLTSGTLSQELYYNTVVGAEYVLSFKAKGEGVLSFTVGDANGSVSLTPEMTSYEVVVTPTTSSDIFRISNVTCTLGNLKLEKGNKATAWNASPLDNTSDRAYYQSMKYIQNAFEGATDISGGLVLTEQIWVGDYDTDNKKWVKMNGGMSGVYESDHDVAFWAGGNINQAIETVMQYADNPTFQPTEEQLASMANFVVTHGGRAILNDAIIRGTIYAKDGDFTGTIHAKDGEFAGKIESTDGHIGGFQISGNRIGIDQGGTNNGMFLYDSFIGFREDSSSYNSFTVVGENVLPATTGTVGLARFELDGSKDSIYNKYMPGYGLIVDVRGYGNPYAFYCPSGVFAGLRPNSRVVTSNNSITLTEYDHTIVFNVASGTVHVYLPSSPKDGQEYDIYTCHDAMDITIHTQGGINMYDFINAIDHTEASYTADKRRHIHIFYSGGQWWENYRYLQK